MDQVSQVCLKHLMSHVTNIVHSFDSEITVETLL